MVFPHPSSCPSTSAPSQTTSARRALPRSSLALPAYHEAKSALESFTHATLLASVQRVPEFTTNFRWCACTKLFEKSVAYLLTMIEQCRSSSTDASHGPDNRPCVHELLLIAETLHNQNLERDLATKVLQSKAALRAMDEKQQSHIVQQTFLEALSAATIGRGETGRSQKSCAVCWRQRLRCLAGSSMQILQAKSALRGCQRWHPSDAPSCDSHITTARRKPRANGWRSGVISL